jgi:hypothetical protein
MTLGSIAVPDPKALRVLRELVPDGLQSTDD